MIKEQLIATGCLTVDRDGTKRLDVMKALTIPDVYKRVQAILGRKADD